MGDIMNKREDLRHKKVVNQIYEATNKTDLPYVSFANISKYLSSRKYLGKKPKNLHQKK